MEHCAVIKFYFKFSTNEKETFSGLKAVYDNQCLSCARASLNGFHVFVLAVSQFEDDPRSYYQISVRKQETMGKNYTTW